MKTNVKLYILDISSTSLEELEKSPFLTTRDKEELSKYKCLNVKKEKTASLILKRKYIGDYYLGDKGKPLSRDKFFNISHSHDVVILGISPLPIGVDIELVRDIDEKLKKYISNQEEEKYITTNKNFFEVWTSKEALSKCIGLGISMRIETIPGLPINGHKQYKEKDYYTKTLSYKDYVIAIVLESKEDFDIEQVIL